MMPRRARLIINNKNQIITLSSILEMRPLARQARVSQNDMKNDFAYINCSTPLRLSQNVFLFIVKELQTAGNGLYHGEERNLNIKINTY